MMPLHYLISSKTFEFKDIEKTLKRLRINLKILVKSPDTVLRGKKTFEIKPVPFAR